MMSAILDGMASWRGSEPSSSGRPGPDGHHDDLDQNELEKISVEIPDDARELRTDLERWLADEAVDDADPPSAEVSWAGRRAARKRRLAITAAVVVVSMAVVAISG